MKKATLFLAVLLTINLQAQIPQKANTIIINSNLSKLDLYIQVNDILFTNGYGILNADKEIGTITTSDKPFKNGKIRIIILVKNNKVILKGDFDLAITVNYGGASSISSWSQIRYFGMKNSPNMQAWAELQKISDAIPGTKEYLVN